MKRKYILHDEDMQAFPVAHWEFAEHPPAKMALFYNSM
jgi:hypothetical protein